ncbi:type VI secretion protein, family [Tritonibacter multivorans]|uniref:Type VI secretion protein, family n=1 Tax=Tritonibacter multivorans TaxID=928856 RepID=A0A0N7LYJ9_9RHOB|nr:type VI secretion system baseplate subunit TssK [Tritonibacter multivorans]MDA7423025.1 type VI secretion system baseplate subunit TssK [Tritonibacter multivorans]CUH75073.1 type VI secretion protein, family [Tritonibacter multivorans]SFD77323.1 type VI secretion system protein ImpJ [Tritonibacter multivorans]
MSRFSKVVWKEGLFLKPQHFQQADRYFEKTLAFALSQTGDQPFPWGIAEVEFDTGQLRQGRLELQKISGVFKDGTLFSAPDLSRLPSEIDVPDGSMGKTIWLVLPNASQNGQDIGDESDQATRYFVSEEREVVDNARASRSEESLEIAVPRLQLMLRDTAPEGYQSLELGQVAEVRDGTVVTLDQTMPPTGLNLSCHRAYEGYLKAVIGAVEARVEVLERYAADPSTGGGMQGKDYLMLMVLNRNLPLLRHLQTLPVVHPERLYTALIALAGELVSFEDRERRVRDYGRYRHDRPKETFLPVVDDIRRFLSRDVSRAVRLPLEDRKDNRFAAIVEDATLFSRASFVIEVKADLPLTEIQHQFPQLCKVGPASRMREIIVNNMPGLPIVHTPTPPAQIRHVTGHVYFLIDKSSPLWREFSTLSAIGLQLAGAWPGLALELWAIPED